MTGGMNMWVSKDKMEVSHVILVKLYSLSNLNLFFYFEKWIQITNRQNTLLIKVKEKKNKR